ncbi:hypothetical protein JM658_17020, partial [Joostella atrarenae]
GQGICDGLNATTYTVGYQETTGASLVFSSGVTDNGDGTLSAAIGTAITITATNGDCESVITVASPESCDDPCSDPVISVSGTECSEDNLTYSVNFTASAGATVTADAGTVGTGVVSGITADTDVTLTISYSGCSDTRTITITA